MPSTSATLKTTSDHHAGGNPHRTADDMIEQLVSIVRAAIAHGHFKITITGTDGRAGFTEVIVTSGKKFRFLVPKSL